MYIYEVSLIFNLDLKNDKLKQNIKIWLCVNLKR